MVKEYNDAREFNAETLREFDSVREYDSSLYRNFDSVKEYHNEYKEFGSEAQPVKNPEEGKPRRLSQESSSVDSDGSGVVAGAESAGSSGAAATTSSVASSVTAAQVVATSFVAIVAVAAVVVPAMDSADMEVSMDVWTKGDILGFYIYLENYSEDETYWAYVSSNNNFSERTEIVDGSLEKSISVLRPV